MPANPRRSAIALACVCAACGRSAVDLDESGAGDTTGADERADDDDDDDDDGAVTLDTVTADATTPTGDPTDPPDPSASASATNAESGADDESTGGVDEGGGDTSGATTSGEPVGCDRPVQIELGADQAELSGDWQLVMSQFGEGMVAGIDMGAFEPTGTVHWDVDVPCDGDWLVWVRGTDFGGDDSFFARLDGEPEPAPIFELDCEFDGDGYVWAVLNWRDPEAGMPCEHVLDPWIAQWSAGVHTFELDFREAPAVARIVVTNDPDFVP
jgi:hypothetical protein